MNHGPSRREFLVGAAGVMVGPASAQGMPQESARLPSSHLPTLREGRGQFVEFEPVAIVPEFHLRRLDGRETLLSSFRGRVLIVNFWATWCPPCRKEIPLLDAFSRNPGASGARAIAISLDQDGGRIVKPYLDALRVSHLPVFLDPEFRVARRADEAGPADPFRLFGLPLSYVLSPGGRNLGYFNGLVDWQSPPARALLDVASRRA